MRWRRGWLGPRAAGELGAEDGPAPMGRSERGATGGAGGGGLAYLREYKGSRYMYISNCRSEEDEEDSVYSNYEEKKLIRTRKV